jgi:hypothetical protein
MIFDVSTGPAELLAEIVNEKLPLPSGNRPVRRWPEFSDRPGGSVPEASPYVGVGVPEATNV